MKMLDRFFDALRTQDWEKLAGCLAENVERTGPYLDVVRGKRAYVEFLSKVMPTLRNYELRVHRSRRLDDGSAMVELSETLDLDGVRTEVPEVLVFDFDAGGRILRVDIYVKNQPDAAGRNR